MRPEHHPTEQQHPTGRPSVQEGPPGWQHPKEPRSGWGSSPAGAGVGIVVPRLTDEHGALLRTLRRRPTVLRAAGESLLGGDRAGHLALLGEVVQEPAAYETAHDAGLTLRFTPDAHGVHIGGEAHVRPWLWSLLTTNRVRLYRKRHGALPAAAFWAAITAGEGLRALAGRETSRAAFAALVNPARRIGELPT